MKSTSREGKNLDVTANLQETLDDDSSPSAFIVLKEGDEINGRYVIADYLGKGGFGLVYAAFDRLTESEVALKFLNPDLEAQGQRLKRIQREINIARRVRHPGLVSMYALEVWNGVYFISMELIRGRTLDQCYERPTVWSDFRPVFIRICRAVQALHGEGIIHRDLKPGNIMITPSGVVKVLDFGLAKDLSVEDLNLTGSVILGSPMYLAPEQLSGGGSDPRCDIYALGLILYRVLTGRHVFGEAANTMEIIISKLKPPTLHWPEKHRVPAMVRQLVQVCLQQRPQDRYEDMAALLMAMERRKADHWLTFRLRVLRMKTVVKALAATAMLGGLIAAGVNSEFWQRPKVVEPSPYGRAIRVKNGLGWELWNRDFPEHLVVDASIARSVNWKLIAFRRNLADESVIEVLLSPVRPYLIDARQSVYDNSADNRMVFIDLYGRLLADKSVVDLLNIETYDFARAMYFDRIETADRDGDGKTETLIGLVHKNSMYPSGFLLNSDSQLFTYLCPGHISWIRLISVDAREWRFLVCSINNPLGHMTQLSEVLFHRIVGDRPAQIVNSPPSVNETQLSQGTFIQLLPNHPLESEVDWPAGGIEYDIQKGSRHVRFESDGGLTVSSAGWTMNFRDDPGTVRTFLGCLNTFYSRYYLQKIPDEGLLALAEAAALPVRNPFLRALRLYFQGCVRLDTGAYDEAAALFEEGHELFPENCDIIQKRCEIAYLKGDPREALALVERYPAQTAFWGLTAKGQSLFRAYCCMQLGRFFDAEKELTSMVFNSPENNDAQKFLVGMFHLYRDGDSDIILQKLDSTLGNIPDMVTLQDYRFLLARGLLLAKKDTERCRFYFNDLYQYSRQRRHMTQVSLAWLNEREDRQDALDLARKGLEEMIRRSRGDLESRFWLFYDAYVYAQLMETAGKMEEARRGYSLCIEAAPHSHLARLSRYALNRGSEFELKPAFPVVPEQDQREQQVD